MQHTVNWILDVILQNILSAAKKEQNINNAIDAGKSKFDAAWNL